LEGALAASATLLVATVASAQQPATEISPEDGCENAGMVHFANNSSTLNGKAKKSLNEVADQLKTNDELKVRIEAFTDHTGSAEHNQQLSEKRATAVEEYLNGKGVEADRLETQARGEVPATEEQKATPSDRVAVVKTCKPAEAKAETPAPAPAPTAEPEQPPAPAPQATAPVEPLPPEPTPSPPPAPVTTTGEEGLYARAAEPRPMSGIGIALSAGAGVVDFTQQRARSFTDPGVTWDVRLTLGSRLPVGLDLAYVGSSQNINMAGFSTDAYLLGQGTEAALRVQYPYGMFRPYVFGGVGWRQLSIKRQNVYGTGFLDYDNQGLVPFGAGIAIGNINGITFDLHGTGRVTWDDDLLRNVLQNQGENSHTNTWDVTARIGGEF